MAHTQTKLPIIKAPDANASILKPTEHPAFKGNEQDDLLCGSCDVVLFEGVSAASVKAKYAAPVQLLVKCPECGSHNNLPAQIGN